MSSEPDPVITRLQPVGPRASAVIVHLDRGQPFEIALEALERHGLGVGDRLSPARRHHLLNDDADIRVRDAALNLLSYRARTRAELRRRLRQKGFRPARIDPCLDRLAEKGFLDDEAVAASFVRDRLRHRPRGRSALAAELRAKGVSRDVVDRAIDEVFDDEETDDPALARSVAAGWVARQSRAVLAALTSDVPDSGRARAKRRLVGYLGRRGFRGPALSAGIERAVELASEGIDEPSDPESS